MLTAEYSFLVTGLFSSSLKLTSPSDRPKCRNIAFVDKNCKINFNKIVLMVIKILNLDLVTPDQKHWLSPDPVPDLTIQNRSDANPN